MKHAILPAIKNLFFVACILNCLPMAPDSLAVTKGFICVPVADLLGAPLLKPQKHYRTKTKQAQDSTSYETLPFACLEEHTPCPRIHQLLYNDIVTIEKYDGSNALINLRHLLSFNGKNHAPQTYWTNKKYIQEIDESNEKTSALAYLPPERRISFKQDSTCVVLKKPFAEQATGLTFSAGTRFLINQEAPPEDDTCSVYLYNPRKKTFITSFIPKNFLLEQVNTQEEKQQQYVNLIREWLEQEDAFIPYVWGGASFAHYLYVYDPATQHGFTDENEKKRHQIKTGFDCSGLILSAAQLCGIPYFYKNTTTLAHYLKEITPGETLKNGDLLYFPGHVQIISDSEKNLIIEAAGYKSGYGKVHEIPIADLFKNKKNSADLLAAFFAKEPLERLFKDGTSEIIKKFKLFRFSSVWQRYREKK
jgi:cell wall-associated NlpC family hydrolase